MSSNKGTQTSSEDLNVSDRRRFGVALDAQVAELGALAVGVGVSRDAIKAFGRLCKDRARVSKQGQSS